MRHIEDRSYSPPRKGLPSSFTSFSTSPPREKESTFGRRPLAPSGKISHERYTLKGTPVTVLVVGGVKYVIGSELSKAFDLTISKAYHILEKKNFLILSASTQQMVYLKRRGLLPQNVSSASLIPLSELNRRVSRSPSPERTIMRRRSSSDSGLPSCRQEACPQGSDTEDECETLSEEMKKTALTEHKEDFAHIESLDGLRLLLLAIEQDSL